MQIHLEGVVNVELPVGPNGKSGGFMAIPPIVEIFQSRPEWYTDRHDHS